MLSKNINTHRTITLLLFCKGVKLGLSPILKEERRLSVFENRVLRRIFGSMRDDVTGDWNRLHN